GGRRGLGLRRGRGWLARARGGAAGRRRGKLNRRPAVEPDRRRLAFLRGDFVLADVFVGQLDGDLELDGDEILAAHLTRASGRDNRLDGGQLLVAAQRFARGAEHDGGGWIGRVLGDNRTRQCDRYS